MDKKVYNIEPWLTFWQLTVYPDINFLDSTTKLSSLTLLDICILMILKTAVLVQKTYKLQSL
jgi:hypothetical protein